MGQVPYYFQVKGTNAKTLIVNWGDTDIDTLTMNGSDQRMAKTYTDAGTSVVKQVVMLRIGRQFILRVG